MNEGIIKFELQWLKWFFNLFLIFEILDWHDLRGEKKTPKIGGHVDGDN